MPMITLSRSDPAISASDIAALETQIAARLPASFKRLFLSYNGGVPNKDCWEGDDDHDVIRVKKFKALSPSGAQDASETRYLGGCYALMTERQVVPMTLLPFAIDGGGNFFCLDLADGSVCFYATDAFDPDSSVIENQRHAYRRLAETFDSFLSGLKDESEINAWD
ncbi:SMI1/KNR4 family protein [Pseudomonas entomophila]|nr:SMI1/KNR4 family protein [Pseudomonas entomophila]